MFYYTVIINNASWPLIQVCFIALKQLHIFKKTRSVHVTALPWDLSQQFNTALLYHI